MIEMMLVIKTLSKRSDAEPPSVNAMGNDVQTAVVPREFTSYQEAKIQPGFTGFHCP